VGSLGFEPRPQGEMQKSKINHRHVCFNSAASFPFFVEKVVFTKASLAGDETDEWKNSQLPPLWQNSVPRFLRGKNSRDSKMPKMWQSKSVEKRPPSNRNWRGIAALFVPRLRISVFNSVNFILKILFSFFVNCSSEVF
jgi:hypothetical protein